MRYGNRPALLCHVDGKSDSSSLIVSVQGSLQAGTSETTTRLSKARFTRKTLCDASQGLCMSSKGLPESIQHPNRYSHDTPIMFQEPNRDNMRMMLVLSDLLLRWSTMLLPYVMILLSRASLQVGKLRQRCVSDLR